MSGTFGKNTRKSNFGVVYEYKSEGLTPAAYSGHFGFKSRSCEPVFCGLSQFLQANV
jgi:hypothetical protein